MPWALPLGPLRVRLVEEQPKARQLPPANRVYAGGVHSLYISPHHLVCDEDALGQHHVNADVSVHELSNIHITCHAGQHISLVVAQMLL